MALLRTTRNGWLIGIGLLCLMSYVSLYFVLTRRAYADADRYQSEGFYYLTLENTAAWRFRNRICLYLFWPLNFVDRGVGTGRDPAPEPLLDLS